MRARKTREDLGLAITSLDSDRLRDWAEKLDTYGPDVTHWTSRRYLCEALRAVAGRIEATVAEVGTLRELAGIEPSPVYPTAIHADNSGASQDVKWCNECASWRHALDCGRATCPGDRP